MNDPKLNIMNIILKNISLNNFKGIKSLSLNFDYENEIYGRNGTGKTSVFDAFTWLFFGKNSRDETEFEIQPLDLNGLAIHKLQTEVKAIIEIDGIKVSLKKNYREKWVTKRGEPDEIFSGYETEYFWNNVPLKEKDYKEKIDSFITDLHFKILSNPLYFSQMTWQKQREILLSLIPEITNKKVMEENPEFIPLIEMMGQKSLDEFKNEIHYSINKGKVDLKTIPTRIDEVIRGRYVHEDWDLIKNEIEIRNGKLINIEVISNEMKESFSLVLEDYKSKKKEFFRVSKILEEEEKKLRDKDNFNLNEKKKQIQALTSEIQIRQSELNGLERREKSFLINITEIDILLDELRKKYKETFSKQIILTDEDLYCPTCKQPISTSKKETEMIASFNLNKASFLEKNKQEGMEALKNKNEILQEIENIKEREVVVLKQIEEKTNLIEALKKEIENPEPDETLFPIQDNEQSSLLNLRNQIAELENEIKSMPEPEFNELKKDKDKIIFEIKELEKRFAKKEMFEKSISREKELIQEEEALAATIVKLEGLEFLIINFLKCKMALLESTINDRFNPVEFRLFDTQINGSEIPCCIALYKGVPWHSLNTGGKLITGITIINTLNAYLDARVPVWVDNRESITEKIESINQTINLSVFDSELDLVIIKKFESNFIKLK